MNFTLFLIIAHILSYSLIVFVFYCIDEFVKSKFQTFIFPITGVLAFAFVIYNIIFLIYIGDKVDRWFDTKRPVCIEKIGTYKVDFHWATPNQPCAVINEQLVDLNQENTWNFNNDFGNTNPPDSISFYQYKYKKMWGFINAPKQQPFFCATETQTIKNGVCKQKASLK